jgi:hypothetical protein
MEKEQKNALFWELAEPLLVSGGAEQSTMMGFPCLRIEGKFFASLEKNTNNLIVKLPAQRVSELIDNGQAQPFAPNGRVFREWALIEQLDQDQWAAFLQEAQDFVRGS